MRDPLTVEYGGDEFDRLVTELAEGPPRPLLVFAGPDTPAMRRAAGSLAARLGRKLRGVQPGLALSQFIGEKERDLSRVLQGAEPGEIVLFFGEAQALFGRRSEAEDEDERLADVDTAHLLGRLEDGRGLAILATTEPEELDARYLARACAVVSFPRPDAAGRSGFLRRLRAALDRRDR